MGSKRVTSKYNMTSEFKAIIEKAADFHGHLGPFLVLGVRMGLIGVRELGARGNDEHLRVTAMTRDSTPFSCIIDGIQVVTKCTIGNRKLKLIDSPEIAAEFELQEGDKVTVTVNPTTFNRLRGSLLSENIPPEEVCKLAQMVASMPEEELFIIGSK